MYTEMHKSEGDLLYMDRGYKKIWALALVMLLTACGTATELESAPTATPKPAGGIDAPGFERTMMNAEREASGEKYVHGEEGYFMLSDEGADLELKMQKGQRTGWVYAASTSMESAAYLKDGKQIKIDPFDILDKTYGDEKEEGYFSESNNNLVVSGHGRSVAATLSNGFRDRNQDSGYRVLTAARNCEDLSPEQIKDAIKTHGAMTMGIKETHNGRGFNDGYFTQYDKNNIDDHIVAIVGWDDHFPKEIFAKTHFVETPSQDGGWIVQDSLIGSDYVYISYDTELKDNYIFESSNEYGEVASYDFGNEKTISMKDATTLANVFHKKGTIKAVGTFFTKNDESITIRIVDEKSGDVLHEQTATEEIKGYYVIPLDKEIEVSDYRVEVTYDGEAPVEGEKWSDGHIKYRPKSKKGQSFVKLQDKWYDLAEKGTRKKLGLDFNPNNACIKALYA